MKQITNLESALEEFKINLNNRSIQTVLETEKYDIVPLKEALDKFLNGNYEVSERIDSNKLYSKISDLIRYTNDISLKN
jgi:hypothetical protein